MGLHGPAIWSKSCDHEIVSALELNQRPYHGKLKVNVVWSWVVIWSRDMMYSEYLTMIFVEITYFGWSRY